MSWEVRIAKRLYRPKLLFFHEYSPGSRRGKFLTTIDFSRLRRRIVIINEVITLLEFVKLTDMFSALLSFSGLESGNGPSLFRFTKDQNKSTLLVF